MEDDRSRPIFAHDRDLNSWILGSFLLPRSKNGLGIWMDPFFVSLVRKNWSLEMDRFWIFPSKRIRIGEFKLATDVY